MSEFDKDLTPIGLEAQPTPPQHDAITEIARLLEVDFTPEVSNLRYSQNKKSLIQERANAIFYKITRRLAYSELQDKGGINEKQYHHLTSPEGQEDLQALRIHAESLKQYALDLARLQVESGYYDPLTRKYEGLSKNGLEKRFEVEKNNLESNGSPDECIVVIEFDINSFKAINDKIGHDKADEVLKNIIKALRGISSEEDPTQTGGLRETDAIGRRSGDEFTVVLSKVKKTEVQAVIDKVVSLVHQVDDGSGGKISITGGARIVSQEETIQFGEASKNADLAGVYAKIQKPEGNKSIRIYNPEFKPDLSTQEKRNELATNTADRELKREKEAIEVKMLQHPNEADNLKSQMYLLQEERELRIQRKRLEIDRLYGTLK